MRGPSLSRDRVVEAISQGRPFNKEHPHKALVKGDWEAAFALAIALYLVLWGPMNRVVRLRKEI
jgi:hypothetical protein